MNNKIIGFILSSNKINFNIETNSNIKIHDIVTSIGILSLYYVGDISKCKLGNNKYSMAIIADDNLLDNNVVISINDNNIIIENDWLGSIPVFYNKKNNIVSTFLDVCSKTGKWNEQGVFNYLKYGFNIFGTTPFDDVEHLRFYSKLIVSSEKTKVIYKRDPALDKNKFAGASEQEIWEQITKNINNYANKLEGDIIIPTSGGMDSRLLNLLIKDKRRIKSYSFGISAKQNDSYEVLIAKEACDKLGVEWKQIELLGGDDYYKQWHNIMGSSCLINGLFYLEFIKKIIDLSENKSNSLCSGIVGDIICQGINFKKITSPEDVMHLAYTHGLNYSDRLHDDVTDEIKFLEENNELLQDVSLYPIALIRLKIIFLSFLIKIPDYMNLPSWTPFLNYEITMKIACLPEHRRVNRLWVHDFLKKNNLHIKKSKLKHNTRNQLGYLLHSNTKFDPIKTNFNVPYISEDEINNINNKLENLNINIKLNYNLTTTRIVKEILRRLGVENVFNKNMTYYQIIKSLEMSRLYIERQLNN